MFLDSYAHFDTFQQFQGRAIQEPFASFGTAFTKKTCPIKRHAVLRRQMASFLLTYNLYGWFSFRIYAEGLVFLAHRDCDLLRYAMSVSASNCACRCACNLRSTAESGCFAGLECNLCCERCHAPAHVSMAFQRRQYIWCNQLSVYDHERAAGQYRRLLSGGQQLQWRDHESASESLACDCARFPLGSPGYKWGSAQLRSNQWRQTCCRRQFGKCFCNRNILWGLSSVD